MMKATRLTAILRGCALGCAGLAFVGALLLAFGLIASDGRLLDMAQTALLRIQLQSRQDELHAAFGKDETAARFDIALGASAQQIADDLVAASLIADTQLFLDFARVEGYDRRFEAGVYFLNQTQSIVEIAALLTDSSRSHIPFRTVEGARIEEVAQQIDSNGMFAITGADFLAQVWEGTPLPADFAAWVGHPRGRVAGRLSVSRQLPTAAGHQRNGTARHAAWRIPQASRRRAAQRGVGARFDAASSGNVSVHH